MVKFYIDFSRNMLLSDFLIVISIKLKYINAYKHG